VPGGAGDGEHRLHQPLLDHSPREELDGLVTSFSATLGFAPGVSVEGRLADVNPSLRFDVLAVVREGLANVARHAHASWADVLVAVDDASVTVEITDNGVGVDLHQARSGLVNLGERAAAASGTFDVRRADPDGTLLRWRAPLRVG